ncbi:hypothetical protein [Flavobacterium sp.]|uniref:hypothetical protein n=1 Tax=Flavobacterium sp. TaxID=239 RepID=UPI0031D09F21
MKLVKFEIPEINLNRLFMNLIKYIRIGLLIIPFFIFQKTEASDSVSENYCSKENIEIKTEFKIKHKYFFFRKTNHKNVKRIDRIVDKNGKEIMKIIMKSAESGDQNWFRKFHRVIITDQEIQEVICVLGREKGKLITYNFCGEKINESTVNTDDLLEKYRF